MNISELEEKLEKKEKRQQISIQAHIYTHIYIHTQASPCILLIHIHTYTHTGVEPSTAGVEETEPGGNDGVEDVILSAMDEPIY